MCCARKRSLQQRAQTAGVMHMLLSVITMITSSIDIVQLLNEDQPEQDEGKAKKSDGALVFLSITLAMAVVKFIMGIILWNGAKTRNEKRCLLWLYVSLFLWTIQVAALVTRLIIGTFVLLSTISNTLMILFRILVMLVVYLFIMEIRNEDGPVPVPI